MALSFKGHAPDFQYWVFNIDGRDWVAVNQSTPQPLKIQFQGRYRAWPESLPLIKTSGFDIISSTTSKSNSLGEKQGTVEWVWSGNRYKSSWVTTAGNEVVAADPEEGIPAEFDYQLAFIGMIPYEGPVTGPVGTGIESEATKQARQAEEAAKQPIPTPVPSLPIDGGGPIVSGPQLPTPAPSPSPSPRAPIPSPVVTGPMPAPASTAPAGTDWVKLGLQLGAAYLLLS